MGWCRGRGQRRPTSVVVDLCELGGDGRHALRACLARPIAALLEAGADTRHDVRVSKNKLILPVVVTAVYRNNPGT